MEAMRLRSGAWGVQEYAKYEYHEVGVIPKEYTKDESLNWPLSGRYGEPYLIPDDACELMPTRVVHCLDGEWDIREVPCYSYGGRIYVKWDDLQ